MILQYWHDITGKVLYLDAMLYPVYYYADRLTFVRKTVECNTEKVLQYLESIAIVGKYCALLQYTHCCKFISLEWWIIALKVWITDKITIKSNNASWYALKRL